MPPKRPPPASQPSISSFFQPRKKLAATSAPPPHPVTPEVATPASPSTGTPPTTKTKAKAKTPTTTPLRPLAPPPPSSARAATLRAKLVDGGRRREDPHHDDADPSPSPRVTTTQGIEPPSGAKLTPLESQIVSLRRANPGVLLVVEVGYKMRFFGRDAETASRLVKLFAYQDKHFLTASFPVHRTPIYVRRLCAQGCKVGLVRQVETAALKKLGGGKNSNKTFDRAVVAIFTPATVESGTLEALFPPSEVGGGGEEPIDVDMDMDADHHREPHRPATQTNAITPTTAATTTTPSRKTPTRILDRSVPSTPSTPSTPPHTPPPPPTTTMSPHVFAPSTTNPLAKSIIAVVGDREGQPAVGLVAVDAATGQIWWDAWSDGDVRSELEGRLDLLSPGEILVLRGSSGPTQRAAARARAQSSVETASGSGSSVPRESAVEEVPRATGDSDGKDALAYVVRFLAQQQLQEEDKNMSAITGTRTTDAPIHPDTTAVAAAAMEVLEMPQVALEALAGAVAHLDRLGLGGIVHLEEDDGDSPEDEEADAGEKKEAVGVLVPTTTTSPPTLGGHRRRLRLSISRLTDRSTLATSTTATHRLEILSGSLGGKRGSLLECVDFTQTRAGYRVLCSWLARPLLDRHRLEERQDAVAWLCHYAEGTHALGLGSQGTGTLSPPGTDLAGVEAGRAAWAQLGTHLRSLPDLPRGLARIQNGSALPADVVHTLRAILRLADLRTPLSLSQSRSRSSGRSGGEGGGGGEGKKGEDGLGLGREKVTSASSTIPSFYPLPARLARLVRDATNPVGASIARDLLGSLNETAALRNDKVGLTQSVAYTRESPGTAIFGPVHEAYANVQTALQTLDHHRSVLAATLGVKTVVYKDVANQGTYLIEVPVAKGAPCAGVPHVPSDWKLICATKQHQRYLPPTVERMRLELEGCREALAEAAKVTLISTYPDPPPPHLNLLPTY